MRRIAITGGIGSGKSVVSSILGVMGFPVYDCDSQAKRIMNTSSLLKEELCKAFGTEAIDGNIINKAFLSKIVFSNKNSLEKLNSIVHPFVYRDFEEWAKTKDIAFVETAILIESGMDRLVDEIWIVNAPTELRIKRVMKRNGLSEDEVLARINSQTVLNSNFLGKRVSLISNDDKQPLIPQIINLISELQP